MGQAMIKDFENLKENFLKETQVITELAVLRHEDLVGMVKELNQICSKTVDADGRMLHFAINCESDTSIFWKGTVQVACIRSLKETNEIADVKFFKLRPFLQAYKMISHHIKPMSEMNLSPGQSTSSDVNAALSRKPISTSMILNHSTGKICQNFTDEDMSPEGWIFLPSRVDEMRICSTGDANDLDECIICMERKPEVTLPCTHSYCLFCIEQWNVSNKTCPVCRETLENPDDSWVIPAVPESEEINAELQKALKGLTSKLEEED